MVTIKLSYHDDVTDLIFRAAKGQFEGLIRRMKTNATLHMKYNDVTKDYLQQDICENVQETFQRWSINIRELRVVMHHHITAN